MLLKQLQRRFLACMPYLFLFLCLFSCNASLEEKLIGNWKGSDFLFVKTDGPDIVATINGGLDQHLNSKFVIKEDGTYEKLVGEYDNGKGTWYLEDDRLIIRNSEGDELEYKLLKLTDSKLVVGQEVSMDTPSGKLSGEIILTYTR